MLQALVLCHQAWVQVVLRKCLEKQCCLSTVLRWTRSIQSGDGKWLSVAARQQDKLLVATKLIKLCLSAESHYNSQWYWNPHLSHCWYKILTRKSLSTVFMWFKYSQAKYRTFKVIPCQAEQMIPGGLFKGHRCGLLSETACKLTHDALVCRSAVSPIGSFHNWKGSLLICNLIRGKEEVRNQPLLLSPIIFITRAEPLLI